MSRRNLLQPEQFPLVLQQPTFKPQTDAYFTLHWTTEGTKRLSVAGTAKPPKLARPVMIVMGIGSNHAEARRSQIHAHLGDCFGGSLNQIPNFSLQKSKAVGLNNVVVEQPVLDPEHSKKKLKHYA